MIVTATASPGLVDDPVPGRSARRGAKEVPLVIGPDDERDAAQLST
jgi:hypothetical protein